MTTLLAKKLSLSALATATVTQYSDEFDLTAANAVEIAITVINFVGSEFCVALELSNDDQNWSENGIECGLTAVDYYSLYVRDLAARRGRLRYDFTADDLNPGNVTLTAEVRPMSI